MGTNAWVNWQEHDAGGLERENFDDEMHSDARFTGGPRTFGPFRLSNVIRDAGSVGPAVVLRGGIHADLTPQIVVDGKAVKGDSSSYHGGTMSDEIAALVSLILGVRLRVAGTRRLSGFHDPEAGPREPLEFEVPRLVRPGRPERGEMLPRVLSRSATLDGLDRLDSFTRIDEVGQVELVRAARAYAAAVWWANEDPTQSWLQLVTAVEIAAAHRQVVSAPAVELVAEGWPELWAELEGADEAVRGGVAEHLARQMRATRRFKDFLEQCAPPPPKSRPAWDRVDWEAMRTHAGVIYDHRSKALHGGKPFPMPMLEVPRLDGDEPQEAPAGLNAGGLGGIWDRKETPMMLCTFEYVVRGALLRWWDEMVT